MICDITATLSEKLQAIRERTPDQQMAREGVPVSIGGKAFEVRPLTRAAARTFKLRQWQFIQFMSGAPQLAPDASNVEEVIAHEEQRAELHAALVAVAIPELDGQAEWLDEHATDLELTEALTIQTAFVEAIPNVERASTIEQLKTLRSLMSTPSSANSTQGSPPIESTLN